MRITHSINRNMFDEYLPSKVALNLVIEKDRTIKSEDLDWEKDHPPRLTEICVRTIAENFEKNSILSSLPATDQNLLVEILPTDLPLDLVLHHIKDGIYWKRRVNDRWKDRTNHVEDYGFNWKRMYIERHVQEQVEGFSPEGFDTKTVSEMCQLASDYVYKLDLRELKISQPLFQHDEDDFDAAPESFDHIDLSSIIAGLKNLTELHIQFGVRQIGSNYKKSLFELSNRDCENIGEGVNIAKNLKVLRIHQSALDDDKVISLLSNMEGNRTLKKIEFSNCMIGDDGAIAMAKYLRGRSNIEEVNLCNNKIGEAGMEALSYVLTQPNTSKIKSLNLKFNAFGNGGLQFLASALIRENPKVENLNISCCDLDEECGILLAEMLRRNVILRDLDLSNNHFGEKVGRAIESGMKSNKTITYLDLRMTGIPNENMINISRNLHFNRIRVRKGEKGVERELHFMQERSDIERKGSHGGEEEEEDEEEEPVNEALPVLKTPTKKKKTDIDSDNDNDEQSDA